MINLPICFCFVTLLVTSNRGKTLNLLLLNYDYYPGPKYGKKSTYTHYFYKNVPKFVQTQNFPNFSLKIFLIIYPFQP